MRRRKIINEGNTDSQWWQQYFRKREAFQQGKKVNFFMLAAEVKITDEEI